jgi:hypothetical protein
MYSPDIGRALKSRKNGMVGPWAIRVITKMTSRPTYRIIIWKSERNKQTNRTALMGT